MAEPGEPKPPVCSAGPSRLESQLAEGVFPQPPPSLQLGSLVLQTNGSLEVIHQNKHKFEGSVFIPQAGGNNPGFLVTTGPQGS